MSLKIYKIDKHKGKYYTCTYMEIKYSYYLTILIEYIFDVENF